MLTNRATPQVVHNSATYSIFIYKPFWEIFKNLALTENYAPKCKRTNCRFVSTMV